MRSRVTLESIARASGVSLATVSLVLRDKPGINDDTRKRVLDAAQVLGYRRHLSSGRAPRVLSQIGVIVKARIGDQPRVEAAPLQALNLQAARTTRNFLVDTATNVALQM